jgi:hypothetical protein
MKTVVVENVVNSIINWDMECVKELRGLIQGLKVLLSIDENGPKIEDIIDLTNLNSAQPVSQIDSCYSVWAIDKKGFALTVDTLNMIENINDFERL